MPSENLLIEKLRSFAAERDWSQFHTPKNLACALSVEASELLEIFQWSRGQDWSELKNKKLRSHVEEELADIYLYLLRFADLADVNLHSAAMKKIELNAAKYPIENSKGSDRKYND